MLESDAHKLRFKSNLWKSIFHHKRLQDFLYDLIRELFVIFAKIWKRVMEVVEMLLRMGGSSWSYLFTNVGRRWVFVKMGASLMFSDGSCFWTNGWIMFFCVEFWSIVTWDLIRKFNGRKDWRSWFVNNYWYFGLNFVQECFLFVLFCFVFLIKLRCNHRQTQLLGQ